MDNIDYNNLDDITKLLFDIVYKKKNVCKKDNNNNKKITYKFQTKNNKNLVDMQKILKEKRNIVPFF